MSDLTRPLGVWSGSRSERGSAAEIKWRYAKAPSPCPHVLFVKFALKTLSVRLVS